LHATLDRVEGEKPDAPQETRLAGQRRMWRPDQEWLEMVSQQTYETLRDRWTPELPPVDFGEHLIPILFEIGPVVPVGMGASNITCEHINPWCARMAIELQPWESRWLIQLSKEYLAEDRKACKHFAPAPWVPDE
jgi:hypothetical protein